jgi:hypothetical protein
MVHSQEFKTRNIKRFYHSQSNLSFLGAFRTGLASIHVEMQVRTLGVELWSAVLLHVLGPGTECVELHWAEIACVGLL